MFALFFFFLFFFPFPWILVDRVRVRDTTAEKAKDEMIAILQTELKVVRQANNMQKQEIDQLKGTVAAMELEFREYTSKIQNHCDVGIGI